MSQMMGETHVLLTIGDEPVSADMLPNGHVFAYGGNAVAGITLEFYSVEHAESFALQLMDAASKLRHAADSTSAEAESARASVTEKKVSHGTVMQITGRIRAHRARKAAR